MLVEVVFVPVALVQERPVMVARVAPKFVEVVFVPVAFDQPKAVTVPEETPRFVT